MTTYTPISCIRLSVAVANLPQACTHTLEAYSTTGATVAGGKPLSLFKASLALRPRVAAFAPCALQRISESMTTPRISLAGPGGALAL